MLWALIQAFTVANIVKNILNFNKQQKRKGLPLDLAHIANVSGHSNLKILTTKQVLQRLPIAFAPKRAGNTSENLPNEIIQIIYSLYRAKEITK